MKKGNDTIQFENKSEIVEIRNMIRTYFSEHPNEKKDILERFSKLLGIIEMSW